MSYYSCTLQTYRFHIGFLPTSTIFHGKCWSMLVHVTVLKPSQTMWPGNMSESFFGIATCQDRLEAEQWAVAAKPIETPCCLVVENGIPVRLLMIPITKLVRFAITKLIKQGWLRQPRNWDSQQLDRHSLLGISAWPSQKIRHVTTAKSCRKSNSRCPGRLRYFAKAPNQVCRTSTSPWRCFPHQKSHWMSLRNTIIWTCTSLKMLETSI